MHNRRGSNAAGVLLLALGLVCALAVAAQAQFTPLCRSGLTGSKNCSGPLNVSHIPTGIPAGNIGAGGVTDAQFGYLAGLTGDYLAGLTGPIQSQITAINTSLTTLAYGQTTVYLHNAASGVATYETLRTQPATGTQVNEAVNVSAATSPQTFDCYISDAGYPGASRLEAGLWRFHHFADVDSNTGVTQLRVRVLTRTPGGVETLHFTADSDELATTVSEYQWTYTQPTDITIGATDRLVLCYQAVTTSPGARTVTQHYEGTLQASHVDTPIASPSPISGAANLVQATPDGSAGVVQLRQVVSADLASAVQNRLCPTPSAAGKLCFDNGTSHSATNVGTTAQVLHGGTTPSFGALTSAEVPAFFLANYGDGSDGNVTCSGATTLTRVMFYNNLTIAAGCDLKPDAYTIYVAGTLSITGGKISSNGTVGPSATGATQCTTPTAKTVGTGQRGGYYAAFNNDGFPTSTGGVGQSAFVGGTGGGGGAGSGGGGYAGGGTTLSYRANVNVGWFRRENLVRGHAFSPLVPGTTGYVLGGGGGALGGSGSGGVGASGGCGGDVIIVRARAMSLSAGAIEAKGGAGASASNANAGGGGGGVIVLDTLSYSNTGTTLDVSGGAGGSGNGTGAVGVAGATGATLIYYPQVP